MEVKSKEDFDRLKVLPFFKGVIVSDSMSPLIKTGDSIVVEVGTEDIRRFDIIVFWNESEKKLTCHYLWAINRFFTPVLYQTRSIRYGFRDHPISRAEYLGKVVSHRLSQWQKLRILFAYFMGGKS